MIVYKDKWLLKKSLNRRSSLSCQHWSLHHDGFQILHFIWNWFGCKLLLKSIQNHTRHSFQAFSHCAVQLESEQTPFPWTGSISFATNWAANFGCNWFRIMPDIVSKHLHTPIRSCCAVLLESEQTPFPWKGLWLGSAALHRIRFGTCNFVPMLYFYSETNEWLQDWAKQWELLWSATTSRQFRWNFHFPWKKNYSLLPNIYKASKPF